MVVIETFLKPPSFNGFDAIAGNRGGLFQPGIAQQLLSIIALLNAGNELLRGLWRGLITNQMKHF